MKVQKDTFLIGVQADRVADIGVLGANGEKIIIDTDYNKYKHTTQIGTVIACPIQITQQYKNDTEIKEGDIVVFHHFVCQPDHFFAENVYRAEYFHLYAKIENEKLMALEDAIFVESILEPEENMFAGKFRIKPAQEKLKQQGIVFAASKQARALGVLEGDKIFFSPNADYQIKVIDKELYRMRIRNIIAVERAGRLVCLHDRVLAKQIGHKNKSGIFVDVKKSHEMIGNIIQVGKNVNGVKAGQKISYYNSAAGPIEWNEETWISLELRNINYIIE